MRRREDARDWQRRFGAESLLTANFLQPTQNEILETLCVLDHLTPGWETGDDESVENHFLHELALNFPSLRKPRCAFPLPFAESLGRQEFGRVRQKEKRRRRRKKSPPGANRSGTAARSPTRWSKSSPGHRSVQRR